MTHQVVAHYIGGRVVKGVSHDINPKRPFCHIRTKDGTETVKLTDLKALFIVKDLIGDAKREEGDTLETQDARARGAHPIEVEFADGERVVGLTAGYPPIGPYFYVLPVDAKSNNVRILVNHAAVVRMARRPPSAQPSDGTKPSRGMRNP